MPAQTTRFLEFASLAGALLLSAGLVINLHLLGSQLLPSTISSAPKASALPPDSPALDSTQRPAQIEFSVAGLYVSLEDALTIDLPLQDDEFLPVSLLKPPSPVRIAETRQPETNNSNSTLLSSGFQSRRKGGTEDGRLVKRLQASGSKVKILIAVTSECCSNTSKSALRRAEGRQTWAKYIWDNYKDADIKFVLAQPPAEARAEAMEDLSREALGNSDLLVIRGLEDYKNLPNKSLRLMRYALSSPSGYTHVLKTDDDCYIRYPALAATLLQPPAGKAAGVTSRLQPQMSAVYKGCLENPHGFYALRNEDSKWHIPYEDMPDWVVPWERKYLAGWGYLLSVDVVQYIVNATAHWDQESDQAPGWYAGLHWEDVLVGLVASEFTLEEPQDNAAFVAAWKGCSSASAVRHLDVEAPQLFQELYQKELQGQWTGDSVKCSEGEYAVDDYWSWKGWRDGLTGVQALGNVGRR